MLSSISNFFVTIIETVYSFLWGDLFFIPLPGGGQMGVSLLVLLLVPTGIYFTIRTRFLPIRLFPDMIRALTEKKEKTSGSLSTMQSLIVSTATRVGMGNLVGVVAAISAGGAGAVFWMWLTAIIGSSTAFIEATLAQLHKEKDPLYGGYRGGPAYYIHHYVNQKRGSKSPRRSILAVLFALSGLICWCGISQVIGNSVSSAFKNAFHIPPLYTTIFLVVLAALIVLRKNASVKVLDILVPIMAACYFAVTIFLVLLHIGQLPQVMARIFQEAFGFRQVVAGGFGAVLMNGVKRGLFSNEAGSGSAPCQRGRLRFCPLCSSCCADRSPCQSRTYPGSRRIYRHHCNLQLYRLSHASGSRNHYKRAGRHESSPGCHELPSWNLWSCLYRHYSRPIQLFHFYRNPVLCPL